jgi:hypothetical protein
MSYKKQTFIDYPNEGYTILKAEHLNKLQDAIWSLDQALDATSMEVEKTKYSTNRFDKKTIPFIKGFYSSNSMYSTLLFSPTQGTEMGVEAGSG